MAYNFTKAKDEFKKVEEWLRNEYASLHTGRATPIILDGISIESYGSYQPIKNIASISVEDPKTLRVVPWDKTHTIEIEKAIQAANIGLSVATDDKGLRVIFPMLTTETRQRLVKVLKEKMEEERKKLQELGGVNTSDPKQFLESLKAKGEEEENRLKEELKTTIKEVIEELGLVTKKDLEAFRL